MSTQLTPLHFDETGNDITVVMHSNSYVFTCIALEFQEHGVMLDYLESSAPARVFIPYANIKQIGQDL